MRFIGEDPLGLAAGDVNVDAYVDNRPMNSRDPTGMVLEKRRFVKNAVTITSGCKSAEWARVKVTTTGRFGFQTHAYQNIVKGQVVEPKRKFLWGW